MVPPTLYSIPGSAPCRAVYLLCKATNFVIVDKFINVLKGENKTLEFTKINPLQTIPVLQEENGFSLADSHAIMIYILKNYIKNDSLYPEDPKKQAIVNQMLFFEDGILSPRMREINRQVFMENQFSSEKVEAIKESFSLAEAFLGNNKYFAGNELTIADFSNIATITSLEIFVPINNSNYPRLHEWIKRLQQLPYYNEANQKGVDQLAKVLTISMNDRRNKL